MAMELSKKFSGDSGNEQRIFIKDARIGWRAVLADPNLRFAHGVTQYDHSGI